MPMMDAADLLKFLDKSFPQAARLKLRIEHVDAAPIRLRLPIDDSHLRPGGTVSGPSLMWLADCGAYLLILAQIGRVAMAVTTNVSMNFLRPAKAGSDLVGDGRLLKLGSRLAVVEVAIRSDDLVEPVAHATLTYSIPSRGSAAYGVK